MSINTGTVNEALFGRIGRGFLGLILLNPLRSFYLLELVSLLRTGRGGVQRELAGLMSAGIVTRRREGVKVFFRAAVECPVYSRLRELLQGMTDPSAAVAGVLDEIPGRVRAAVMPDAGGEHSSNQIRLHVGTFAGSAPVPFTITYGYGIQYCEAADTFFFSCSDTGRHPYALPVSIRQLPFILFILIYYIESNGILAREEAA